MDAQSFQEYLVPALAGLCVLLTGGLILLRLQDRRRDRDRSFLMLQEQVQGVTRESTEAVREVRETLESALDQVRRTLSGERQAMDRRLDHTGKTLQELQLTLGAVGETNRQVLHVSRDLAKLQEALQAPKFRGGFGELFLADLLSQILPEEHYSLQHRFEGGQTVDAVIRLQGGLIPVDAKFPLSAFQQMIQTEDPREQARRRKQFQRDIRAHMDSIAEKYIRPDEGTLDLALMYIPAENVYYETVIRPGDADPASHIWAYGAEKGVLPVSPMTFYGYLQTLLMGLKGLRIEAHAREILDLLSRLQKRVDQIREDHRVLGRHLDSASTRHRDESARLDALAESLIRLDLGEAQEKDSGEFSSS